MQSVSHDSNSARCWIVVWAELRVPLGQECDEQRWAGYFQPVVHATGHKLSLWARLRYNPGTVILATHWSSVSACREFENSPSAQLYKENLTNNGITFRASHEFPPQFPPWFQLLPGYFIHVFWVYLKVPVTQEQKDRIGKRVGIRIPVDLSTPRHKSRQPRLPMKLWATRTEFLHGQEVQLLLWPHIWKNEEASLYRFITFNRETNLERFHRFLREVGSIEFKEDLCQFQELRRL